MNDQIQPHDPAPEHEPGSIEELDAEFLKQYSACSLCGKRISKSDERIWCKNCGWRKNADAKGPSR